MLVLGIAGLILGIGLPNLFRWQANRNVAALADQVASEIRKDISEATAAGHPLPAGNPLTGSGSGLADEGFYQFMDASSLLRKGGLDRVQVKLCSNMSSAANPLGSGRGLFFFSKAGGYAGGVLYSASGSVVNPGQIVITNTAVGYLIRVTAMGSVRVDATDPNTAPSNTP